MSFQTTGCSPTGNVRFIHILEKGNAIVLITADAPDQDRQYAQAMKMISVLAFDETILLSAEGKSLLRLQSFRRESFWSEMPGRRTIRRHRASDRYQDFQHTEHGKGEQKQVQTVCVSGPCRCALNGK